MLDDIAGINSKCIDRGTDFIMGGDTNMVVREKDIGKMKKVIVICGFVLP